MNFIELKKFKISIHPIFLLLIVIITALGYIEQFFIFFIIITIHELTHILVAKMFKVKLVKLIIYPLGQMAVLDNIFLIKPIKRILIICLAPIMNIFLGFMFIFLDNEFLAIANFSIGIFNSLPIYPLDGGKLLYLIFARKVGILNADKIIIKISRIFTKLIILLGFIQVILYPYNISIICIGVYLEDIIKKESFNLQLEFMRNILTKSDYINKYGIVHMNSLVVLEDTYIKDVLKYLKIDSLCILHIVDKELNLIESITETQLINFAIKNTSLVSIKEIVKI